METATKEILIAVKAYPNPSRKYGETVCVAGIDIHSGKWIRLYPIPFRDLEENKKFRKYSTIKARMSKTLDDKRPESYRIDASSIQVLQHFDTKDRWKRRSKIVIPAAEPSFCMILKKCHSEDLSLGLFKPHCIDFVARKSKSTTDKTTPINTQLSLFGKRNDPIETIPFDFRYTFLCQNESSCPGHDLPIIDWEVFQAFRNWRRRYTNEKVLLDKIRERWLLQMCSQINDVYFFVGNMKRFRSQFIVLGVFYPPKV